MHIFHLTDYILNTIFWCLKSQSNPKVKHVYFSLITFAVSNSTTVTAPTPTPVTVTANFYDDKFMVSLTLGLGCVLLIICIVCVIHIHYKGKKNREMSLKIGCVWFIANCFRLLTMAYYLLSITDSIQSVLK